MSQRKWKVVVLEETSDSYAWNYKHSFGSENSNSIKMTGTHFISILQQAYSFFKIDFYVTTQFIMSIHSRHVHSGTFYSVDAMAVFVICTSQFYYSSIKLDKQSHAI